MRWALRLKRSGFARAVSLSGGATKLAGTIVHGQQIRLVEIDGFEIDFAPQTHAVVTHHADVPGIVGKVGTILGDAGINISTMSVARRADRQALMVLAVDRAPTESVMVQLKSITGLNEARTFAV